ncbi:ChbG/HpnK family deacetylase [Bordetella pertussis]|nr:ChbG/HpnK family deacetylase [Bordetella pertussis]
MTSERYDEGQQPAHHVGPQRGQAGPFHAGDRDGPMGGGRGASDGNEPGNLSQQAAHVEEVSPLRNQAGDVRCRRIAVCGDDFGMNEAIDGALIELAGAGRLSAVSCMPLAPAFAADAPALARLDVDLGVHVDFTEAFAGAAPAAPGLAALLWRAYAGQLDPDWIDARLASQFDAFERAFGRAPDYVDGHQHVHQLPGILPRLRALLKRRYAGQRIWLRHTAPGLQFGLPLAEAAKARLIGALGARALARAAGQEGWQTNRRMLGVYGFTGGPRRYAGLLHHWLMNARDGDLLMCHPGWPQVHGAAHASQRAAEYEVLAHPELGTWLARNGLRIVSLSQVRGRQASQESGKVRNVPHFGSFRRLASRL